MDLSNKKVLISSKLKSLPKIRQCELLNLNRATLYYKKKPIDKYDLKVMKQIDKIYTNISSTYGYRYMSDEVWVCTNVLVCNSSFMFVNPFYYTRLTQNFEWSRNF